MFRQERHLKSSNLTAARAPKYNAAVLSAIAPSNGHGDLASGDNNRRGCVITANSEHLRSATARPISNRHRDVITHPVEIRLSFNRAIAIPRIRLSAAAMRYRHPETGLRTAFIYHRVQDRQTTSQPPPPATEGKSPRGFRLSGRDQQDTAISVPVGESAGTVTVTSN